jgi:hypothetical protein
VTSAEVQLPAARGRLPGQARALFGDFIEGRWEQARRKLHEDMRGHVDIVGRIADGWADPASPVGGSRRLGAPSTRQFGDYTVVELPLTFNAGEGLGRVALDQEGKVDGLSMQRPRCHRLDPRHVRIVVHGVPAVRDLITAGRPHRSRRQPRLVSNP